MNIHVDMPANMLDVGQSHYAERWKSNSVLMKNQMIILQFSRANDSNCIRQHALLHNFPLMWVTLCWLSKVREKRKKTWERRIFSSRFRSESENSLRHIFVVIPAIHSNSIILSACKLWELRYAVCFPVSGDYVVFTAKCLDQLLKASLESEY